MSAAAARLAYLWDYDIDAATFAAILRGETELGKLNQEWAACRLLEYAPYEEIVTRLGFPLLAVHWPVWRERIRSPGRRRGIDWLVSYLAAHHPDLLS